MAHFAHEGDRGCDVKGQIQERAEHSQKPVPQGIESEQWIRLLDPALESVLHQLWRIAIAVGKNKTLAIATFVLICAHVIGPGPAPAWTASTKTAITANNRKPNTHSKSAGRSRSGVDVRPLAPSHTALPSTATAATPIATSTAAPSTVAEAYARNRPTRAAKASHGDGNALLRPMCQATDRRWSSQNEGQPHSFRPLSCDFSGGAGIAREGERQRERQQRAE